MDNPPPAPQGPRPEGAGRHRSRGRRRGGGGGGAGAAGQGARPKQAPAAPQRPIRPTAPGDPSARQVARPQGQRQPQRQQPQGRPGGGRPGAPRPGAQRPAAPVRPRSRRPQRLPPDDLLAGAPCIVLLDLRDGDPDRSGSPALFEGYFDFETGELRRSNSGIPRLRVGEERVWGFEIWWRPDPDQGGLTEDDRNDLETSKRLLRGLLRDTRRAPRFSGARPPLAL